MFMQIRGFPRTLAKDDIDMNVFWVECVRVLMHVCVNLHVCENIHTMITFPVLLWRLLYRLSLR